MFWTIVVSLIKYKPIYNVVTGFKLLNELLVLLNTNLSTMEDRVMIWNGGC